MKSEGYIVYEHVNGERFTHFRKRTALNIGTAECRIHDVCRSTKWTEQREFSIWNALTPIMKVFAVKHESGRIEYIKKNYLLPAIRYTVKSTFGNDLTIDNALGYEKDYRDATAYRKNITCGARSGDLTSWIKSEKRIDKVPLTVVNKNNYKFSEKVTSKQFGK
jgi:hypothetical protein